MEPKFSLSHANIINLLGVEALPLDEKKEILETATELVEIRVLSRLLNLITRDEQKKFQWHLDRDEMEKALSVIKNKGISLNDLYDEEIEKVKNELLYIAEEADGLAEEDAKEEE
jgi:hypothetical protein